MDKVLLTGATGYLGSKIVSKLIDLKKPVLCIILRDAPLAYLEQYKDYIEILYTDEAGFDEHIREFHADTAIHTAGRYERGDTTLTELIDANLCFPLRVINAILPQSKNIFWLNTNTALDKYLNNYALSKHQFAEWGYSLSKAGTLNFCNVLLEQFYGEGDSGTKLFPSLIEKFMKNVSIDLTDGLQRRDFVYIYDVIDAYMKLCEVRPNGYTDIPLGTGEAPTVREVIEYTKDCYSSLSTLNFGVIPRRPGEPEISIAKTEIMKSMGITCKYDWKTGIKKMAEAEKECEKS